MSPVEAGTPEPRERRPHEMEPRSSANGRWRWVVVGAVALLAAGCAAGPNLLAGSPGAHGVAGFWLGLWHGMICPIAFVISFFKHGVSIYEVHNNGHWYNFGFILGAGAWGILGGGARSRS
jgi:hypothetical protein